MESLVIGAIASLGAGLATVVGALPILLPINLTQRVQGIMLGFGGGVRFRKRRNNRCDD
jgi:ZIP family zinc transporter